MTNETAPLITILGPTASGKTTFATHLAATQCGEILSGDSRQVYRGMDIGTGKDLSDYIVDGQAIPYHLIDICDPGTKYNLFRYQEDFMKAYEDIRKRGAQPILCGGTGLYIESVLKGYHLSPVPQNEVLRQELAHKTLDELTDVDSCQRAIRAIEIETYNLQHPTLEREYPPISSLIIGLNIDREARRQRITQRLQARLNAGMIAEVEQLLQQGIPADDLIYYGLEYKFVTEYVVGKLTFEEMFRQLEIAIHQFAKRQMTWFRGMERRGFTIHWIDAMLPMEEKLSKACSLLQLSYQ